MKKIYLLSFALAICDLVHAQLTYPPRNEVYRDSSLASFVCKLQYALVKKDKSFLYSVIDKDIKFSFGDGDGIEDFKKSWNLDGDKSNIWLYLSKVISLGGVFQTNGEGVVFKDQFVFPYVFDISNVKADLDVFSVMVVTGKNVNMREKPDKNSKSVTQLNYDVVNVDYEKSYPLEVDYENPPKDICGFKEWYYVTTMDKKFSGYVNWDYLWSPVGYRLFLDKIDGSWKITCFIAGD